MIMTNERTLKIAERLRTVSSWNNFAKDILGDMERGRIVTANRLIAAESMMDKLDAKKKAVTGTVNLDPIARMFEAAILNGLRKPAYRAEGLKITLAPANGRNAGALYVVRESDDTYLGKIVGTTYQSTSAGNALQDLLRIAADPLKAAVEYGRKTGRCACCGRELTNEESIELGIGPICKERFKL